MAELKDRRTYFDDVMGSDLINLTMGCPSEHFLKMTAEKFQIASSKRMEDPDARWLFHYGSAQGDGKFLDALAKFLSEEYKSPVDINDLFATSGATFGLQILINLLFTSNDLVFVENPSYFIATKMIGVDAGMNMLSVNVDENGIIPDELEKVLEANKNHRPRELTPKRPFWGMLYLISTTHNPTGALLTADRCRRVVELARKYDLLVVSDDVYNLLYFGENPPHRLFEFDKKTDPDYKGNVVSNASFSKIFGPGCRLGWLEAPKRLREIILSSGTSASAGGFNHCMSGVVGSVISLGFLKEMVTLERSRYREQAKTLTDVLRAQLPSAQFVDPMGGYFLWVKLPDGISGEEVAKKCKEEYKTFVLPGNRCSIRGDFKDYIRITFSFNEKDIIRQGAENIVKVVKTLQ